MSSPPSDASQGVNTNPFVPCGPGGVNPCTPADWKWRQGLILMLLCVSMLIFVIMGAINASEGATPGAKGARAVFFVLALLSGVLGLTAVGIQLQPLASPPKPKLLL